MSLIKLLGAWLLMALLMIANGIFRELVLQPRFGETVAGLLSVALGVVIILVVTRPFLRPLAGATAPELAVISVAWVVLTVIFEFTFGHWVDGKSWTELAGNYAIWRGQLWPVVLATVAAAPFIWTRRAGAGSRARGR